MPPFKEESEEKSLHKAARNMIFRKKKNVFVCLSQKIFVMHIAINKLFSKKLTFKKIIICQRS